MEMNDEKWRLNRFTTLNTFTFSSKKNQRAEKMKREAAVK